MNETTAAMRVGTLAVAVSAVLHLAALPLSGFSVEALPLLIIGGVYAGFAYGLLLGARWVAYVAFVVLFIGISLSISRIWSLGEVPGWLYAAFAVVNGLAVFSLFLALWRAPKGRLA